MPEVMHTLVADARKSRFSFIPKLSNEDVISVWDAVAEYVETQMHAQKGVNIPGLGSFTFVQKKLEIGNNKILLIQRPVFVLSEKFAQTHALQHSKHHTTGEIPIVALNFTAISLESPFDRDVVESCVREVLQALSRAISNQQGVEFLFRGIGVLYIKDCKIKMKFFKDFINSVDGSGNLLKLMENLQEVVSQNFKPKLLHTITENEEKCKKRPGTTDSVMSTQTTLTAQCRPDTTTLTFPKLNGAREFLPPIHEDVTTNKDENKVSLLSTLSPTRKDSEKQIEERILYAGEPDQSHSPFKNKNDEDRIPTPPQRASPRSVKSAPAVDSKKVSEVFENAPIAEGQQASTYAVEPDQEPIERVGSRDMSNNSSCCSSPTNHHHRAGQELCYVCMQRGMRNIPVSFAEERKRKEREQDALLQQYQQMKDQEAILVQKANQSSVRQSLQKIAAYNLGVAQGIREAKTTRNTDFIKSYVFQNRPLTPLRFYKQDEYNRALETQVKMKRSREGKEKQDREFQERLEQVQLAEDLAAQRERFLREKAVQVSQYQRALSAQIRSKPLPMPKSEPDSAEPVFGKHDATNTKLFEQRERSRNLLQDQLNTISQKKKHVILKQLSKQKEESEMLARTKKEMIADRIGAHRRSYEMRKALEENWKEHHKGKLSKEDQERARLRTPGMLLLQQTDPYRRCGQCQRGMHNCGESNIWSESRYIPGSRLMV